MGPVPDLSGTGPRGNRPSITDARGHATMGRSTVKPGRTATGRTIGTCGGCGVGIATDGATTDTVTTCPQCGVRVRLRMVYGEHSDIPCDGRCMGAAGPSCSCACGGENHGRWNLRIELVPVWERASAVAAQERRRAEHAARQRAAADRRAAARDALTAAHPDLAALLTDRYADAGGFMWDMRAALQRGEMSPGQIAAAVRAVRRDRERDAREAQREAADAAALAAGVEVPAGKLTFAGTVLSVKFQEGYVPGRGGHKMLVQHADGWKAYGSVPAALEPDDRTAVGWERWRRELRGRAVTITATLAPSKDDPLFGYFTRPRLVSVVDVGEAAPAQPETTAGVDPIGAATAAGRAAYADGRPRAAGVDPAVCALVDGLAVGGGAAGIFAAFTRGFDAAADEAAAAVLADAAPRSEWPGQLGLFA